MERFLSLLSLISCCFLFCAQVVAADNAAEAEENTIAGFEKIKSLVGEWNGTLPDGNPIKITYEVISGGAVVEIFHSADPMWWNMSSAYHLDNEKIMMTHFCSWGNHPRMSAKVSSGKINTLQFDFIDLAENEPNNGYMHNLKFNFKGKDHLIHHWVWREKGKDTPLTLVLKRAKKTAKTAGQTGVARNNDIVAGRVNNIIGETQL